MSEAVVAFERPVFETTVRCSICKRSVTLRASWPLRGFYVVEEWFRVGQKCKACLEKERQEKAG